MKNEKNTKKEKPTQTLQGKRLQEVLKDLKKKKHIKDIASVIGKTAHISVDVPKLSQFCTGYIQHIPNEIIVAFHICYNVNPLFIRGESEVMYDNILIEREAFNKLVKGVSLEKINCTTPDNMQDFLILKVKRDFYNCLLEIANLPVPKKPAETKAEIEADNQYNRKVSEIFIKYNKLRSDEKKNLKEGKLIEENISYGNYALFPDDYVIEIADDEEESHYVFNPQGYKMHIAPKKDSSNHKD